MSMAKEALKIWLDLPVDVRGKILSNVWCPDCSTAVTICDYSADFDGGVVVLRGFCGTCGHKVARVLEGCGESPKKKSKCALEYYIFDIWLYGDEKCTDKKRIADNLRISQERFEDEMKELYYREPVTGSEIKKLSDEILTAL